MLSTLPCVRRLRIARLGDVKQNVVLTELQRRQVFDERPPDGPKRLGRLNVGKFERSLLNTVESENLPESSSQGHGNNEQTLARLHVWLSQKR